MQKYNADLRYGNWRRNLVRSSLGARWLMGPLALMPRLLYSFLIDTNADEYVWSVCFSPDSKLLATAAEDGVVRVSLGTFMLAIVFAVIVIFEANAQYRTTFGVLGLGHRQEASAQQIQGSHPGHPLGSFLVGREIPRLWVGRSYNEDLGYDGRVVEDHCNHRQY